MSPKTVGCLWKWELFLGSMKIKKAQLTASVPCCTCPPQDTGEIFHNVDISLFCSLELEKFGKLGKTVPHHVHETFYSYIAPFPL